MIRVDRNRRSLRTAVNMFIASQISPAELIERWIDVQGSANRWALGCVNPAPWLPLASGGEFTQTRAHLLADPCIFCCEDNNTNLKSFRAFIFGHSVGGNALSENEGRCQPRVTNACEKTTSGRKDDEHNCYCCLQCSWGRISSYTHSFLALSLHA